MNVAARYPSSLYRITETSRGVDVRLRCGHVISYWTSGRGGYVFEESEGRPGTLGQQVGETLAHGGHMMTCGNSLVACIRHAARSAAGRETLQDRNDRIEDDRRLAEWQQTPDGIAWATAWEAEQEAEYEAMLASAQGETAGGDQ